MSARRALLFSFADRYSALVLSIASTMVIARLLTPADIGTFSVTMVFVSVISSMRDIGAGQYLVQEKELTPARVQACWTVLLGCGLSLSLLCLAVAHPVATLFNEPRMSGIMLVIALNFAINPLGSITYAWMMREMRFGALASMRFTSSMAGAITSVTCAWRGYGPISLAWGNVAATLVNAMVATLYRPTSFSFRLNFSELRHVLDFGGRVWLGGILKALGAGAPEFVLGKVQSLTAAGLYSRGNGLAALFSRMVLDATTAVTIPVLSKAKREGQDTSAPLLRVLSCVIALGWAFFASLTILGYPMMRLLYGNQWGAAVPLMRFIAIGSGLALPGAMATVALLALGRGQDILRTTIWSMSIQTAAVVVGALVSMEAAGIGFMLANLLLLPMWVRCFRNDLGVKPARLMRTLWGCFKVAALTALVPAAGVVLMGQDPSSTLALIIPCMVIGLLTFAVGAIQMGEPIGDELRQLAISLKRRRG